MSYLIQKPVKTIIYFSLGISLRLLIANAFKDYLQSRVEITTPINSWKRAQEAVHLWDAGLNPYLGNIFHEFPLAILLYKFIEQYLNRLFIFALVDCLTGLLLSEAIYKQSCRSATTEKSDSEARKRARLVLCSYLLSPLAIASCAGFSTSIFTNFLIATILLASTNRLSKFIILPLCSLLSCNNIHYSTLTIPTILILEYLKTRNEQNETREDTSKSNLSATRSKMGNKRTQSSAKNASLAFNIDCYRTPDFIQNVIDSLRIWLVSIATILICCFIMMNNNFWPFFKSTYLFTLKVQDLTPNIGMFWYFFTEVFETYLDFFTWIVQINAFIHALPITITFRDDPYFAYYIVLLTSTIFQPYPSLANIALLFSATFQWTHLFPHLKRSLIVCCACLSSMSLWVVFWHLWIVMGTANANFYFGATLAFTTSIILFMIDLFNAHVMHKDKLHCH